MSALIIFIILVLFCGSLSIAVKIIMAAPPRKTGPFLLITLISGVTLATLTLRSIAEVSFSSGTGSIIQGGLMKGIFLVLTPALSLILATFLAPISEEEEENSKTVDDSETDSLN